jgi:hypothetical protein
MRHFSSLEAEHEPRFLELVDVYTHQLGRSITIIAIRTADWSMNMSEILGARRAP